MASAYQEGPGDPSRCVSIQEITDTSPDNGPSSLILWMLSAPFSRLDTLLAMLLVVLSIE